MIVEGLIRSGLEDARHFAQDIAIRWLKTNYATFKETGFMHEKYNVESCGIEGGGGEYDPQVIVNRLSSFFINLNSYSDWFFADWFRMVQRGCSFLVRGIRMAARPTHRL